MDLEQDEVRKREFEQLLDAIQSGAIDDMAALEDAQLALLRAYLSDDELVALFDRAAEGDRE